MKIDWWTLGFQTVNVAVLIWLLGHFFWKPVAGMIETRRASAQKLIDDAEAKRAEAATALAAIDETRAGFKKERDTIVADAHKAADAERTAILDAAKTDAEALLATAKAHIAKDAKAQDAAWSARSADLATNIAGRLAARLDGETVQACFLDWMVAEIGKLPELERHASGASEMDLEIRSAVKLDAAGRKACGKAIAEALGRDPHIAFRTDASLIAGFELHGHHLVVRSSWRADLATIRADLAQ